MYRYSNSKSRCTSSREMNTNNNEEKNRKIFKRIRFYLDPLTIKASRRKVLHNLIRKHGGTYSRKMNKYVTHIMVEEGISSSKLRRSLGWQSFPSQINVVYVSWLSACIRANCCLNIIDYAMPCPRRESLTVDNSTSVENNSAVTHAEENEFEVITILDSSSSSIKIESEFSNFEYITEDGSSYDDGKYDDDTSCDDDWLRVPPIPVYFPLFNWIEDTPCSKIEKVNVDNNQTSVESESTSSKSHESTNYIPFCSPLIASQKKLNDRVSTEADSKESNSLTSRLCRLRVRIVPENSSLDNQKSIIVDLNQEEKESPCDERKEISDTNEEKIHIKESSENKTPEKPYVELKNNNKRKKKLLKKQKDIADVKKETCNSNEEETHIQESSENEISEKSSVELKSNNKKRKHLKKRKYIAVVKKETGDSNEEKKQIKESSENKISEKSSVELKSNNNEKKHLKKHENIINEKKETCDSDEEEKIIKESSENEISEKSSVELKSNNNKKKHLKKHENIVHEKKESCGSDEEEKIIKESSEMSSVELKDSNKKRKYLKKHKDIGAVKRKYRLKEKFKAKKRRLDEANSKNGINKEQSKKITDNEVLSVYTKKTDFVDSSTFNRTNSNLVSFHADASLLHQETSNLAKDVADHVSNPFSPEIIIPLSLFNNSTPLSYGNKESLTEFSPGEKLVIDSESEVSLVVKMIIESVTEVSLNEKIIKETVAKFSTDGDCEIEIQQEEAGINYLKSEDIDFSCISCDTDDINSFEPESNFNELDIDFIMSQPGKLRVLTDADPYPVHIFRSPLPSNVFDQTKLPSKEYITSDIPSTDPEYQRYYSISPHKKVCTAVSETQTVHNDKKHNLEQNESINIKKICIEELPVSENSMSVDTADASISTQSEPENIQSISSRPILYFNQTSPPRSNSPVMDSPYHTPEGYRRIIALDGPNRKIICLLQKLYETFKKTKDRWRIHAYEKAILSLSKHPKSIESLEEVLCLIGVGTKIAHKIWTIAEKGELKEVEQICCNRWVDTRKLFTKAWGISPRTARKLYIEGHTTILDLRTKSDLSRSHLVGLRYYEDLKVKMSKIEAGKILSTVLQIIFQKYPSVQCDACSSLRRNRKTCGHVCILVTLPRGQKNDHKILPEVVAILHQKGYLIDDLIRHEENGEQTTYSGLFKYSPQSKVRKIHITVCTLEEQACALLYLTGPSYFNRSIRQWANKREMVLDEHSVRIRVLNSRGGTDAVTRLHIQDEATIFRFLELPYRTPEQRERCKN